LDSIKTFIGYEHRVKPIKRYFSKTSKISQFQKCKK
jgi:hypothetical protein